jgi:hypothetical protein
MEKAIMLFVNMQRFANRLFVMKWNGKNRLLLIILPVMLAVWLFGFVEIQ